MKRERKSNHQENELLRKEIKRLDEINRKLPQNATRASVSERNDMGMQKDLNININNDNSSTYNGQKGDSQNQITDSNVNSYNNKVNNEMPNTSFRSQGESSQINSDLISGILKQFQAF